jgi:hypothetical protein
MIAVSPEALAAVICLALLFGVWLGEREGYRRAMSQRIFGDTPARLVWLAALKVSKALEDAPRINGCVMITSKQAREWSAMLAGRDKGK